MAPTFVSRPSLAGRNFGPAAATLSRPWTATDALPRPLAYGVSITTEDGILLIGGSDAERHYRDITRVRLEGDTLVSQPLAPLPVPLANMAGALLGGIVYVAGGQRAPLAPLAAQHSRTSATTDRMERIVEKRHHLDMQNEKRRHWDMQNHPNVASANTKLQKARAADGKTHWRRMVVEKPPTEISTYNRLGRLSYSCTEYETAIPVSR